MIAGDGIRDARVFGAGTIAAGAMIAIEVMTAVSGREGPMKGVGGGRQRVFAR